MTEPRTFTFTIALGATVSNEIDLRAANTMRSWSGTLIGPATLPETVSFQVGNAAGTYGTLQSPPGTDVSMTGSSKAISVGPFVASKAKLVAGGAVAAARVFSWEAVAAR